MQEGRQGEKEPMLPIGLILTEIVRLTVEQVVLGHVAVTENNQEWQKQQQ